MVKVFQAALRVCKGLVAFVVEGQTEDRRWTAEPALLMADLHRAGIHLRKPPIYRRCGVPGSGSKDWLRNDYEFIVCAARPGMLPWADNKAMGHIPKYAPGGAMSNRLSDGTRVNEWGAMGKRSGGRVRQKNGKRPEPGCAGSEFVRIGGEPSETPLLPHTKRKPGGEMEQQGYNPPAIANPGNVVQRTYTAEELAELLGEPTDVVDCSVGGGRMGDPLASVNEAPFPESLAEFFVRSFCPEGEICADVFSGSGTTAAVCLKWGRRFVGCDLRDSQVQLSRRRIKGREGLFDALPAPEATP